MKCSASMDGILFLMEIDEFTGLPPQLWHYSHTGHLPLMFGFHRGQLRLIETLLLSK